MKRILIGGLLGGLVVYIWMFFSWMVLPFHTSTLHSIPKEAIDIAKMTETMTEPGVYLYPGFPSEEEKKADPEGAKEEMEEKYRQGPRINMMVYNPDGAETNPMMFIRGLVISLLSGLIAAYLLSLATPSLPSIGRRILFVAMIGLFAALVAPVTDWNWWEFPCGYTLTVVFDHIIGWTLGGLLIAWRIKEE